MWILKRITDGTIKCLITEKCSYTLGRKNCDIVLEDDSSISRKHCTIYIARKENCPFDLNTMTGIWIVDEESKYGTFLNSSKEWVKLEPGKTFKLVNGSVIKFGLMENIWSFEYKPIVACTSGISNNLKKEIENSLKSIDGELKSTWTKDCSLVIVNEITLTVKVVLALINGVPIVTSHYVDNLLDSVKNQIALPEYKNFKPEIKESILDASLISLDVEVNRKELFKNKKFVIPTKQQLETLKEVISSAGGKVELLSSNNRWEPLGDKNVIVIQLPLNANIPESLIKAFKEMSNFLKDKYRKRIIPESEIAQAVAYNSVEKYCNPEKAFFTFKRTTDELDQGAILVEETPIESEQTIPEPCIIPCTSTMDTQNEIVIGKSQTNTTEVGIKRNHSPEFNGTNKKIKNAEASEEKPRNMSLMQNNYCVKSSEKDLAPNQTKKKNLIDYFEKKDKSNTARSLHDEQDNSTFWGSEEPKETQKRKLSTDKDSAADYCKRKKFNSPSDFVNKPTEELVSAEEQIKKSHKKLNTLDKNSTLHFGRKTALSETEKNYLNDFFEKENIRNVVKHGLDDLNNTIYSLSLISPNYLNDDGSLIDPPIPLVNVKKFKKQLVYSKGDVMPTEEKGEDIPDNEWLEPHPLLEVQN